MLNNKFVNGLKTHNGLAKSPAYTFLTDSETGLFLAKKDELGITSSGKTVALFGDDKVELLKKLRIKEDAVDGAVLTSDEKGDASWKVTSTSGSVKWNTIYSSNESPDSNIIEIKYPEHLSKPPSISIAKESDAHVANLDLYITNKTSTGFKLYSESPMIKTILKKFDGDQTSIGSFSIVRLYNGGIGICYFQENDVNDYLYYTYSTDETYETFSKPVVICEGIEALDICYMALVAGNPAIVYIDEYDSSSFSYVRADDANGSSWKTTPVVLMHNPNTRSFNNNSLILKDINGIPTVFTNNYNNQVVVIQARFVGSVWNEPINIDALNDHYIIDVILVHGNPAVLACSNKDNSLHFIRSLDGGLTWPKITTQIYKSDILNLNDDTTSKIYKNDVKPLLINSGTSSGTIGYINNALCIIGSELNSNSLYIAMANDPNGDSWEDATQIATTNTTQSFPKLFQNNNSTYLIYNDYTGPHSKKNIIQLDNKLNVVLTENFIHSLNFSQDHQVIKNTKDNNNIIVYVNNLQELSLLKFYGNDLIINWIAMV
jgi:hypothetical protein